MGNLLGLEESAGIGGQGRREGVGGGGSDARGGRGSLRLVER